MATKTGITTITVLILLNTVFFTLVTANNPNNPQGKCPIDALKLRVCANLLNNLLGIKIGSPQKEPCCSLIRGLADVDAAACVCTALKAKVLGLKLNVPLSLSLLLNECGCKVPKDFTCP
ncbi:hypothetical protein RND81_13G053100 [Saponaria officinalis]|uniref:Bifunctional inhibitor/plant lipid transfer protein/seed storage helical domain-containing protein n=1 Tax=Saponaria officinalis TaxID=3572 RepID=A0AAW1GU78_SAPOF